MMKSDLDAIMKDRDIDAVVVFGNAEDNPPMYYFVGGGHVSNALLIKKVGAEPVLFHGDMERDEAAKSRLKTVLGLRFVGGSCCHIWKNRIVADAWLPDGFVEAHA
jgi:hypothetical protein